MKYSIIFCKLKKYRTLTKINLNDAILGGGNAALGGGSAKDVAVGAGIGALAGWAGGAAGGYASWAMAAQGLGGFAGGAAAGATGGFTGGLINGFGSGLYYSGGDLGTAVHSGVRGAWVGTITGGIGGGIVGMVGAYRNTTTDLNGNPVKLPNNVWNGSKVAKGRTPFSFKNTPKPGVGVGKVVPMMNQHLKGVHDGQQGKHQVGHNNYVPKEGRSILTADPRTLLNDLHTGKYQFIDYHSRNNFAIVKFNQNIGTYYQQGVPLGQTPYRVIHYQRSTGLIHVVPWWKY
ncbi:MAG: polymorphic toxin type 50 domain-containing protein [Bacteroidota bacterium]|nr:polymorphic toxin type 50 domain-containing protein [Bacteroidota bacterium]